MSKKDVIKEFVIVLFLLIGIYVLISFLLYIFGVIINFTNYLTGTILGILIGLTFMFYWKTWVSDD